MPLWMIEGSMNKLTEEEVYVEEECAVKLDIHRSASANIELNREITTSYGATGNNLGIPENPVSLKKVSFKPDFFTLYCSFCKVFPKT